MEPMLVGEFMVSAPPSILRGSRPSVGGIESRRAWWMGVIVNHWRSFCTLIGWETGLLRSCILALLSEIRAWRRPCGRIFDPLDASKIFKLLTRKGYYPPKYIQPDWCPGPSTNKVVNSALELQWDRYEAPAKPPRIHGSSFNQWKWVVHRWVAIQL